MSPGFFKTHRRACVQYCKLPVFPKPAGETRPRNHAQTCATNYMWYIVNMPALLQNAAMSKTAFAIRGFPTIELYFFCI
ncbi:hypothetical protein C7N43_21385 [Sphingobacteriales bacterium UPWRP_1]|nr:hypothetical protein B6N25_01480 [Sphingobacteriales bacterium TSM_CSS]PSJ74966.1 hypothetical protein C7N43_21385 [Sphingobacteriales bacterium UPWRP_1]